MTFRECCGSDRFCFISWSNQLAVMAGPDDLFNLLVHVGHHTFCRSLAVVRTIPWWPSWKSFIVRFRRLSGITLPRFSSCSFWARPTTLTSPFKWWVPEQSFRIWHVNFWNFSMGRLNPTNKAKKVNFRPYHATTSNSWHYSFPRSVCCWSIVVLVVV